MIGSIEPVETIYVRGVLVNGSIGDATTRNTATRKPNISLSISIFSRMSVCFFTICLITEYTIFCNQEVVKLRC
ncbi:MAG: hypothetical protein WC651_05580, partial [Candidatus Gracilibacteria bacterium]